MPKTHSTMCPHCGSALDQYGFCPECDRLAPAHCDQSELQQQEDWITAEYELLNDAYSPDYADYRKASFDLKNYWR